MPTSATHSLSPESPTPLAYIPSRYTLWQAAPLIKAGIIFVTLGHLVFAILGGHLLYQPQWDATHTTCNVFYVSDTMQKGLTGFYVFSELLSLISYVPPASTTNQPHIFPIPSCPPPTLKLSQLTTYPAILTFDWRTNNLPPSLSSNLLGLGDPLAHYCRPQETTSPPVTFPATDYAREARHYLWSYHVCYLCTDECEFFWLVVANVQRVLILF